MGAARNVQQYVYRSVLVELGPGRFSRDHWVREPWFDRGRLRGPHQQRVTEGKITPKSQAKKPRGTAGPTSAWTKDNSAERNGLYVRIGFEDRSRNAFVVIAKCEGSWCGGHLRKFTVWQWNNPRTVLVHGCNTCAAQLRRQARQAARLARKMAGQPLYARGAS
jgi:hypothetical protein